MGKSGGWMGWNQVRGVSEIDWEHAKKGWSSYKSKRRPLLSCWDPCPIAEILSETRLIPYCSPNSVPTILWDSNTMLTKPLNSEQPPRPPMHYHCSLRTPNDLQEPWSHFCLCLSSSFHFSPLELWSHFHIPISVFTFPFSIYHAISVLLLSHSSLRSTTIH